jgi:hypothetical protein
MSRLVHIATVWSLITAPALCRAGALTVCCTHREAPITPPACCGGHGDAPSDEAPCPMPSERECGSCAEVCNGVAKPAEVRGLHDFVDHLQTWYGEATPGLLMATTAAGRLTHDCVLVGSFLSYPASDLPLRI